MAGVLGRCIDTFDTRENLPRNNQLIMIESCRTMALSYIKVSEA